MEGHGTQQPFTALRRLYSARFTAIASVRSAPVIVANFGCRADVHFFLTEIDA
jgi:hypothetical protein